MAITQEELETELHKRFDAAQAAQLYDEESLISHPGNPLAEDEGRRDDIRDALVGILEQRFDTREEVEFAFLLMAESYALGAGP
jgi:hypothetical protein